MQYKPIYAYLLLIVVAIFAAYFCGYRSATNKVTAKVDKEKVATQAAAVQQERKLNNELKEKLEKVENEKIKSNHSIQSMRAELNRLQQYANVKKLSSNASSAGKFKSDETARGWTLFGDCTKEYGALAEVADGWRDALAQWQAYGEVVEGMK